MLGPLCSTINSNISCTLLYSTGIVLLVFNSSISSVCRTLVPMVIILTKNLWVHRIRLHGRRGKGKAESFSREKLRHGPQKEGG